MPETNNNKRRTNRQQPIDNTYAHLQPQAAEVERAVIGALLIDKDAYAIVCEMLYPESFYEPRNQMVYSAIRDLSLEEKPVDMLTVTEQLAKKGLLEEVGGPAYIAEISSKVASSAHIEYHARIIAQKFLARQLISFAGNIETKAFDETIDVDELMQEAEGSLFELSQKNMKKDYTQVDPVIKNAIDIISKAAANTDGLTGVPTGYHKLDDITSGWQSSDLVIIAGRPAMGKTSFALSLAKNISTDARIPIAFFSLEMSNVQLVNRLISNVCEIQGSHLQSGQLQPDEWDRLDKRINNLYGAPLYVDDTPGLSVFELRTKARRLVREHGVKIIMIDYLQLMNANGMRFSSRQEEVSTISRSLKGLAKELDIPILALSQLNRGVESREGLEGKRPQLSDLRESGAIEQDADMVLFVHRPEYYHIYQDDNGRDLHGMAQIIIAKHRKGATGDVLLTFRGEYTRFENPEDTRMSNRPANDNGGEIIGSKINGNTVMGAPPVNFNNAADKTYSIIKANPASSIIVTKQASGTYPFKTSAGHIPYKIIRSDGSTIPATTDANGNPIDVMNTGIMEWAGLRGHETETSVTIDMLGETFTINYSAVLTENSIGEVSKTYSAAMVEDTFDIEGFQVIANMTASGGTCSKTFSLKIHSIKAIGISNFSFGVVLFIFVVLTIVAVGRRHQLKDESEKDDGEQK